MMYVLELNDEQSASPGHSVTSLLGHYKQGQQSTLPT